MVLHYVEGQGWDRVGGGVCGMGKGAISGFIQYQVAVECDFGYVPVAECSDSCQLEACLGVSILAAGEYSHKNSSQHITC